MLELPKLHHAALSLSLLKGLGGENMQYRLWVVIRTEHYHHGQNRLSVRAVNAIDCLLLSD